MDAIRVAKVEHVVLERTTPDQPYTRVLIDGTLHLTPHHLIFSPTPDQSALNNATESATPKSGTAATSSLSGTQAEVWIPYPTITVLQRLPQSIKGLYPLQVGTKTFDTYTLSFQRDRQGGAEDVWQSVRDCAVAPSVEQLYAFYYSLPYKSPMATTSRVTVNDASVPPLSINSPPLAATTATATGAGVSAVAHVSRPVSPTTGWAVYNPRLEFARQGVGSRTKAWRFTDINRDYSYCPTYPAKLVVPSRISDSVLAYASKYRSKARIPALTYLHWANHASITRSSQPMVGLKNSRSAQDERLIECIFSTHVSPESGYANALPTSPLSSSPPTPSSGPPVYGATPTNLIIDARPTTNAVANVAKGAGTENMEWYKSGKKVYLGIDNIHVMRNSLRTIVDTLRESDQTSLPVDRERLRKSNWLRHISSLLDGTLVIVRNVHINSSHVLIHCSDGWDRTSQLSATAQICLDPYYRTFEGFKVLVEKDWLSFGYMFLHRSGHLSSEKLFTATPADIDGGEESEDENEFGGAVKGAQAFFASVQKQFTSNSHLKEVSPVFHQFLDCLHQLQRQFPDRFEFNEDYLLDLHYHLYACQFGTFLFDSERQRRTPISGKPFIDRTVSAWDWFDLPEQRARYRNASYNPSLDDRTSRIPGADMGVLLVDPKDVCFWNRLFKRSFEEMNTPRRAILDTDIENNDAPFGIESSPSSRQPSPRPSIRPPPTESTRDSFRPFTSTSSAFSMQKSAVTSPPASSSTPPSASSSPFARLSRTLPAVPVAQGWNWSQLSNGALRAVNQIKTISTDALGQLRAEAGEIDGEMWSGQPGSNPDYAAGTGIGEGRTQAPAVPPAVLPRLRMPSEANPWSTESPEKGKGVAELSTKPSTSTPPLPTGAPSSVPPPLNRSIPARQPSWNSNPWGETTATPPSLTDLRLDDSRSSTTSVSVPRSAAVAPSKTSIRAAPSPVSISAPRPVSAAQSQSIATASAYGELDKATLEAALGGDQKAWDPLGAL